MKPKLKSVCICNKPTTPEQEAKIKDEFKKFIVEEINTARSEGIPTSHLTAIYNRLCQK